MTKRSYVEAVLAGMDEVEVATLDSAPEAEVQAGKRNECGTRIALGRLCSLPVVPFRFCGLCPVPVVSLPSLKFRSVSVGSIAFRLCSVSVGPILSL